MEHFGIVLEFLAWIGGFVGLALLFCAWIVQRFQRDWKMTTGIVFADESRSGYRWFDHLSGTHEQVVASDQGDLDPEADVKVFYDARNPERWQFSEPFQPARGLRILGWILLGVGVASACGGLLLLMLDG